MKSVLLPLLFSTCFLQAMDSDQGKALTEIPAQSPTGSGQSVEEKPKHHSHKKKHSSRYKKLESELTKLQNTQSEQTAQITLITDGLVSTMQIQQDLQKSIHELYLFAKALEDRIINLEKTDKNNLPQQAAGNPS